MVGLDEGGTGDDHREPRGRVAMAGHCHSPCRKGIPVVGGCSLMHPTHRQELRPQVHCFTQRLIIHVEIKRHRYHSFPVASWLIARSAPSRTNAAASAYP